VNVLGQLDGLIQQHKLANVAVFVGSEAARGVPKLRIPRRAFASCSVNEFASVINGSYYGDTGSAAPQPMLRSSYIGALWMGSMARLHPELRFVITHSTRGTGTASGKHGL
jgi:hypothetical protein